MSMIIETTTSKNRQESEILSFLNANEFVKAIFEDKISTVMDEIDMDLYEISKLEAEEMLEQITPLVERIDGTNDGQTEELKRYLHTFKGCVRMAGANKLGMLSHRLESLLDYAESRNISLLALKPLLDKEIEKVLFLIKNPLQSLDEKKLLWLDEVVSPDAKEEDKSKLTAVANSQLSVQEQVSTTVVNAPKKDQRQYIRILSSVVDSVINEAGEIRLTRTALEGVVNSNKKAVVDLRSSSQKLLKMLKEIEIQAESQIQARRNQLEEEGEDFDPLEFDRFTRLQELTRFMTEAVADIQDTVASLDGITKQQDNMVVQQSILTNNLLDVLMKVRLIPMDTISDRLYKITRNTAKELDKKVSLELRGEKTEIDRLVLDKVTSPLEHLLRNCIAHGIESSQDRINKGKPATGKVLVETLLEGNFIIIKVADDGAGINVDKVRKIALSKGIINEKLNYSTEDIINLIFHSGFSTADSVSQVSGRGVGMDVVKNDITALGGSVSIKTEKDQGTVFTLTLPVSVATNQALLCEANGKLVAIPALLVEEVISVKQARLAKAYESKQFEIKGQKHPFFYIGHLLGLSHSKQIPEVKTYNSLIKVKYLDQVIVVHVDKINTTTEILVKAMGSIFGKISGILGATLLGDGRQGVVVNPVLLKNHYQSYLGIGDDDHRLGETQKRNTTTTVMVVDDSITVRRATSKVLERYNYNIILAKDGEDALEQLQITIPDIILSDIEMPRMDGFELVKNIRSIDKYSNIPIIMITSRTAEKHRNLAYEMGANEFLGKPYKEEELIEKIRHFTTTKKD